MTSAQARKFDIRVCACLVKIELLWNRVEVAAQHIVHHGESCAFPMSYNTDMVDPISCVASSKVQRRENALPD